MSGLGARNLNLNLDLATLATGGSAVGRLRYNTADYRKYLDAGQRVVPTTAAYSSMRFSEYWDANQRSYACLEEFLGHARTTWAVNWVAHLMTVSGADEPPYLLARDELEQQVLIVLDRAADRDDRFMEIIDQHTGDGCINYWLGMLAIDPARHPATYALIRAAARIGEMVVMCLKEAWRCPRPSELCPAIVPMFDPPVTPAYPAGHALQSRLITRCLDQLDAERTHPRIPQRRRLLNELANRIGENRVIAGLHFPTDNSAGVVIADECFELLWNSIYPDTTSGAPHPFRQIFDDAKAE